MPRAPKPKDIRQNTERRDVGDVPETAPEPLELPPPHRAWLRATKRSWERYWGSPARLVTVASLDLDGLERLWDLYDERERAQQAIRRPKRAKDGKVLRGTDHRVVEGSEGQQRPNGLYNVISRLDAEIRQLEDRAGKSAKARLILGMRVGDAGRPDKPDDGDVDASDRGLELAADDIPRDPRLYVLDGKAG